MSSEENEDKGFKISIDKLSSKEAIPIWLLRCKLALKQRAANWNSKTNLPMPTNFSLQLLTSSIIDDYLEEILHLDPFDAPTVWQYFQSIQNANDLTAKTLSLQECINFDYPAATMVQNRTLLQVLTRKVTAAFGGESITPKDLVTLFAYVNLPTAFHSLRSAICESKSSLEFDSLFQSLIREENLQEVAVSSANRALAKAHISSASPASAKAVISCSHYFDQSKCFTCNPSKKSTCLICKSGGFFKFLHKTGSNFCKKQQTGGQSSDNPASVNATQVWNPDSGTSDHITNNKGNVRIYSTVPRPIQVASGHKVFSSATGSIDHAPIPLTGVLVCSDITQNLLSISKLADQNLETLFTKNGVYICQGLQPSNVILAGEKHGAQYSIRIPEESTSKVAISTNINDWHKKFNHLHASALHRLTSNDAVSGLNLDTKSILNECAPCLIGKARHSSETERSSDFQPTKPGHLIQMDIVGPISPITDDHFKYLLVITDSYTKFISIFPLKRKSDALQNFKQFDMQIFNRFGYHVTFLRSDNEFKNQYFNNYCTSNGIIQQFIVFYESSQMGNGERVNLTIFNPLRCILSASGINKKHWVYAAQCVVYTRNLSLSATATKTPYELFWNAKPNVSHLQVFGSYCYSFIHPVYRKRTKNTKLANRSELCRFFGYSLDHKAYILRRESDGKFLLSTYQNTKFVDNPSSSSSPVNPESSTPGWTTISQSSRNSTSSTSIPLPLRNTFADFEDESASNSDSSYHTVDDLPNPNPAIPASAIPTSAIPASDIPVSAIPASSQIRQLAKNPFQTPAHSLKRTTNPSFSSFKGAFTPQVMNNQPLSFQQHPAVAINLSSSRNVEPNTDTSLLPRKAKQTVNYNEDSSDSNLVSSLPTTVPMLINLLNSGNTQWYKLEVSALAYAAQRSDDSIPKNFSQIASMPDKEEWIKATDTEIASLIELGTWELVPPPKHQPVIPCMWVFRIKRNPDGSIFKYKSRLCACGNHQTEGIDYGNIYSPVARVETFRIFLVIMAARKMHDSKMDCIAAFLNGFLKRLVYMKQPPGYINPEFPNHVLKLIKNLYGLKQAPRIWHQALDKFLKSIGFTSNAADPCLYFKWKNGSLSMISLHVDDLAIACDKDSDLLLLKSQLNSQYQMTDEGRIKHHLGMDINYNQSTGSITMSNHSYITSLLASYNMQDSLPVRTPMDTNTLSANDCPLPGSSQHLLMQKVPYRECVAKLSSLARTVRPDITYSVNAVSRYMANPGHIHWNAVKRILRYLKSTSDLVLDLTQRDKNSLSLSCYVDANYAGDTDTSRSTSGYIIYLGSALVSWSSQLQSTIATSSTHSEHLATYSSLTDVIWHRNLLESLSLLSSGPTILHGDCQPSLNLANDHMVTKGSKHYHVKLRFINEVISSGSVITKHISGLSNPADLFTKPLPATSFLKHSTSLGLLT